ncbi:GAF and ANTAR domain-containing protein [Microbacteriaceae bacterium VKM Ac-2854]|nr:GAF and ANTAR domain-containing protein [Microbacteriaceae bacterium VKM Ac-2854]
MTADSRESRIIRSFVTVADSLTDDYDVVDLLHGLVLDCVEIAGVTAGGMMLDGSGAGLQLVASTSEQADFVEVMQLNAGSGPCLDSFATGRAFSLEDLERDADAWPVFRDAALGQGFRAVHCIPLHLRGAVIGSMNLFDTTPGALSDADLAVVQGLADVATIGILQERLLRESTVMTEQLQRALESRIVIEQAKGVLSVTARISTDEAFEVLRRHARANRVSLRRTADRIVDRTLRLGAEDLPAAEDLQRRGGTSS